MCKNGEKNRTLMTEIKRRCSLTRGLSGLGDDT